MPHAHVEPRRCAHCRMPSNRCPCRHCGSCSTSGGDPERECACGVAPRTNASEPNAARSLTFGELERALGGPIEAVDGDRLLRELGRVPATSCLGAALPPPTRKIGRGGL